MKDPNVLNNFRVDNEEKIQNLTKTNQTHTSEFEALLIEHNNTALYYSILIFGTVTFELCKTMAFFYFITKTSTVLHNEIFSKIMRATMGFFDSHLSGNILNRFAKDIAIIDDYLPYVCFEVFVVCLNVKWKQFTFLLICFIFRYFSWYLE